VLDQLAGELTERSQSQIDTNQLEGGEERGRPIQRKPPKRGHSFFEDIRRRLMGGRNIFQRGGMGRSRSLDEADQHETRYV
jgi:hypothetical protein